MPRHLLYILLSLFTLTLQAQQLKVNAPSRVPVGENFRVAYTLNTNNTDGRLHLGQVPGGLDLIYGPSVSTQESIRIINGHTSGTSSTTFTYTFIANRAGTFTLPPARISVEGRTLTTPAVKITATPSRQHNNQQGGPRFFDEDLQRQQQQEARMAGTGTNQDLFIRVSASKRNVHEQEALVLTYKVYTLVDLTELNGKMPDLKGFHVQEVPQPQQKSFHTETIGGRTYRCVTWSQYVMYPQMTGTLEIPSITFKGTIVRRNRYVDPLEEFFNGGSGYVEQRREIKAPPVTIHVEALPKKPDNFSGAVGRFSISAQPDKQQLKTGEPLTIRCIVSGTGNMKLMKQPEVNFPKSFERYDTKSTDKTRLTANGLEGNMIYDYLAVPTKAGQYTIPAIRFTYYDTQSNSYKTATTDAISLSIEQGDGSVDVADYSQDNDNDIHALHTGKSRMMQSDDFFFLSTAYWVWLVLLLIVFATLLYMFRRKALLNANIIMAREKKAEKVANRRLTRAAQLMQQGHATAFYDEVLRTLWGYTSDKLHMPAEQLTRQNIRETLTQNHIDDDTISLFITALDECEYEQYAPGDTQGNMQRTYNAAQHAIMEIESGMKNRRKQKQSTASSLYTLLAAIAMIAATLPTNAVTKENADQEYAAGNYQQAIKDYEQLLKTGASADVYYNLGNAYYRTDNITKALLNYERARLLSPGDADIRHNLQVAQAKTIDKIPAESEMFFITWAKAVANWMSVDRWATTSIAFLAMALVMLLVYLFTEKMRLRKAGFFGSICFLTFFIIATTCAWTQRHQLTHRDTALIIAPSANIKRTPDASAPNAFVLHEGTKVIITDTTLPQWKAIRIADGRTGWIETRHIEVI